MQSWSLKTISFWQQNPRIKLKNKSFLCKSHPKLPTHRFQKGAILPIYRSMHSTIFITYSNSSIFVQNTRKFPAKNSLKVLGQQLASVVQYFPVLLPSHGTSLTRWQKPEDFEPLNWPWEFCVANLRMALKAVRKSAYLCIIVINFKLVLICLIFVAVVGTILFQLCLFLPGQYANLAILFVYWKI